MRSTYFGREIVDWEQEIKREGVELYYDPYLAHYGVKGMKWGVRRYRNEDGSLTREGLRKYGVEILVS